MTSHPYEAIEFKDETGRQFVLMSDIPEEIKKFKARKEANERKKNKTNNKTN